ncbi:MAG: hypothetical protein RR598_04200 [Anaerorhabdus sp.]|uniref:hypothetical protein n=1 Tax=Anaerorhabdus sp. TaxID=1872524 RepID=UPI002FC7B4A4
MDNSSMVILFVDVERAIFNKNSDCNMDTFSIRLPWDNSIDCFKNCNNEHMVGIRGRIQIKKIEVDNLSMFVTELVAEKISFLSI